MRTNRRPRIDATVLGAASLLALALGSTGGSTPVTERFVTVKAPAVAVANGAGAYVGVWMSADDTVRLDISADSTYERSIIGRKRTARGRYHVHGTSLVLDDESGVRTTVTGTPTGLLMAGYDLSRI
jgi:hypothetical protein